MPAAAQPEAWQTRSDVSPADVETTTYFLRQSQVLAMVPISGATLWRWVKAKKFPAPVKLSIGVTAWRLSDVREWERGIEPNH